MKELLTAEQVLAEVDAYCAARGNSMVAAAMRSSFEKTGEMPAAVLSSLGLRQVRLWQRTVDGKSAQAPTLDPNPSD